MRRTPRDGSGTGHGHVAQRPDVLGISDIKEITWDDYYSQRDTVEFCQREPHLVTIHNENSGKHKIDEIKNFDFLFFAFSGKLGNQSLRFRLAKTVFFGITFFLYQNGIRCKWPMVTEDNFMLP